ncbi:hypothetical protein BAUCODRAFT_38217 [Baudoinia panamericana UAMH 10762]|uniref:Autophagy-related protein 27 n=1 Tax=Baudoinia panamericana (strain UAMH 10762) TaxID=717646 RepID=M2LDZ1_BAUPA|nr:uncharacterized protein BAUCODRAFT_38217 [Baudoinia panamericana UAMH 10762]EMC92192.1 hypothetical protein BAUCODRAFT_38217 [Baudoinia panamericana UAMH 10762]
MLSPWHTLCAFILLPASITAVTLDCRHIRIDEKDFDLSELTGPKTVHWQQWQPPSISNLTFTIDLCKPLKRSKGAGSDECPTGTRVCGVEELYNIPDNRSEISKVIPIAGEFTASHGLSLDPEITRLKESSNADQEGLRIELHGGKYIGQTHKAIIELHCNRNKTGNECCDGSDNATDIARYGGMNLFADDSDDDGDYQDPVLPDLDKGKSIQFVSFKEEKDDIKVLRLTWQTKYACEDAADLPSDGDGGKKRGGLGFFSWFIIIVFLLVAAYIIFGSWLNYNRYGARGWDLIPHGDTIRDIPYIVKEWAANIIDRMKSGGSRGGYSAV